MITDNQVRKMKKFLSQGRTLEVAASCSGMDEKTARKYRDMKQLPSELKAGRVRKPGIHVLKDMCLPREVFHVPHKG